LSLHPFATPSACLLLASLLANLLRSGPFLDLATASLLLDEARLGHLFVAALTPVATFLVSTHDKLNHVLHLEGVAVNSGLHILLLFGSFHDFLLDGALGDDSIDGHGLGLADSVRAVCGLLVHCGVPIVVIEDHRVGRDQVHTQTTCARAQ